MGSEELDELIAEALRSYSAAAPRLGIERRVSNRVAAVPLARRRSPVWAFGVAVVAAGVVAAWILPVRNPVRRPSPEIVTQTTPEPPVLHAQIPLRHKTASPSRRGFWAPAPLTEEEKALLALVERDPFQAQKVLSNPGPEPIEPVTIEEISIPPLEANGQ